MRNGVVLVALLLSGCASNPDGYRALSYDPMFWGGIQLLSQPSYVQPMRAPVTCWKNGNFLQCN